jgi:hypothetical protein
VTADPACSAWLDRLGAFLQDVVIGWIEEHAPGVPKGDLLTAEWPLPEYEEVAKVTGAFDPELGVARMTIRLIRTDWILATIEWVP